QIISSLSATISLGVRAYGYRIRRALTAHEAGPLGDTRHRRNRGTGAIRYSFLIAALLACHHAREHQPGPVEPALYRGPAVPSVSVTGSATGARVGGGY